MLTIFSKQFLLPGHYKNRLSVLLRESTSSSILVLDSAHVRNRRETQRERERRRKRDERRATRRERVCVRESFCRAHVVESFSFFLNFLGTKIVII